MVNPVVFFADFFFLAFFLLVYFFLGFAFFLSSSFYLFLSMREDREIEKKRGSWVWLVERERERE